MRKSCRFQPRMMIYLVGMHCVVIYSPMILDMKFNYGVHAIVLRGR